MSPKSSVEGVDFPPTAAESVQSSFRLPPYLHQKFRTALEARNETLTSVIQELIQKWIDGSDRVASSRRAYFARSYLSSLPAAVVVKDLAGRVLFGNSEFATLIGATDQNILGKLPQDYARDKKSAKLIAGLDETVRTEGKPILCIEHMPFNRKPHDRLAIRFPIPADGDLELTGVIGFDLEQLKMAMDSLGPASTNKRLCEFPAAQPSTSECPSHCLKDFLHSLPAIATVKDLDGRLLCVNAEYSNVLGKHRSEVENHLSTEIWDRPFADLIMAHDELVRRTERKFLSVENVPTRFGLRDRLNLRFPVFNADGKLEMTGTLGFDFELMREGLRLLRTPGPAARGYLFLPATHPNSLKEVFSVG